MVREGRFRADLLFRLNVVRIQIPPLRNRGDDIRLLLDRFLNELNSRFGKKISSFSKKALEILKSYPYPGNVRELQNIVEYAVNICQERQVLPQHLPSYLTESPAWTPETVPNTELASSGKSSNFEPLDPDGHEQTWAAAGRRMIMDALVKAGGRRSRAAELMRWGRSTLWRKMKQYGISTK